MTAALVTICVALGVCCVFVMIMALLASSSHNDAMRLASTFSSQASFVIAVAEIVVESARWLGELPVFPIVPAEVLFGCLALATTALANKAVKRAERLQEAEQKVAATKERLLQATLQAQKQRQKSEHDTAAVRKQAENQNTEYYRLLDLYNKLRMQMTSKNQLTEEQAQFVRDEVARYARFVASLALENGAVVQYLLSQGTSLDPSSLPTVDGVPPEVYTQWQSGHVVPYFSHIAVLGALVAAPLEPATKPTAAKYIAWYLDRLNTAESDYNGVDGTVYDYDVFVDSSNASRVVEVAPDQHYDSTDSYAACFLRLLREYHRAYGDSAPFGSRRADVDRVVAAMLATFAEDVNLTAAKPDYAVCYLMDNAEVYDGCVAAAELYASAFGDDTRAEELRAVATAVASGAEQHLFDQTQGTYYPYCFPSGKHDSPADWGTFYADATCQLFPATFGLLEPAEERAQALYRTFNEHYKKEGCDWTQLTHGSTFPWAVISRAAAVMGDAQSVLAYAETMHSRFADDMSYPMYNAEAGQILCALKQLLDEQGSSSAFATASSSSTTNSHSSSNISSSSLDQQQKESSSSPSRGSSSSSQQQQHSQSPSEPSSRPSASSQSPDSVPSCASVTSTALIVALAAAAALAFHR